MQRSGTTWLQRYFTAASDIFVWGESHLLIEGLLQAYHRWPDAHLSHWGVEEAVRNADLAASNYFPNLAPEKERVLKALRRAILEIYPDPASVQRKRWGWKEVRYGPEEIDFVRLLFPDIRIIFVTRNPYDAVRSIRRMGWIDKNKYFTTDGLARKWTDRTGYYREFARDPANNAFFIRYEDVRDQLDRLDAFAGVGERSPNAMSVLEKRLGSAPTTEPYDLTDEDIEIIGEIGGELAASLDYGVPAAAAV